MMQETVSVVPTIDELLAQSAATEGFRNAVIELQQAFRPNDHIKFGAGNPPVKVLRAICGLLEAHPEIAVDTVTVFGQSGCSDYRGTIEVNGGESQFKFVWDCAWKAQQEGWKDYFGNPDQIRAARTYGYRCFEVFEKI